MANEKTIQTRVIQKHDVEANWLKATNFSPKQGEIIIYDIDENYNYERMKIGDGVTNVNDLPFIAEKEAISINAVATGEIVTITDASPLEHEMGVKLSTEKRVVGEITNMDNGEWDNSYNYGDYIVVDVDEGSYGEGRLIFHDGTSLECGMLIDFTSIGGINGVENGEGDINIGDTVRFDYHKEDYIDEEYWHAYLLKGASIEDFSTVTLTKYGKNFFNENKDYGVGILEENGEKVFYNSDPSKAEYLGLDITDIWEFAYNNNLNLSVSLDIKTAKAGQVRIYTLGKKTLDINKFYGVTTEWKRISFTTYASYAENGTNGEQCKLSFYGEYGSGIIPYVKNIQIELGDSASEYEPYKAETYTPNADGTVDNVTSYYPTTTLITDTDGIIIEAEYIKNVNEALGVEPTDTASTLVVGANIFDMLRFTKQTLTDAQKAQVIENLGLADYIRSIIQEESETVAQNYLDTTIAEEASW